MSGVKNIVNKILEGGDVREALRNKLDEGFSEEFKQEVINNPVNKVVEAEDSSYRKFYSDLVSRLKDFLDIGGDYFGNKNHWELICKAAAGDAWEKFNK